MKIIDYVINQINPAKYNPRKITEKEISGLKESIKKFGFVDPLIVNVRDKKNILVGGHQRLKVAEQLKHKIVPVVEVDLSLSEEKALNVALNSPTISGDFDKDILGDLLNEIKIDLPDLFDDLNFGDLGVEKLGLKDLSDANSEIDIENFGNDLEHTCPKCGFEFNE